MVEQGAPPLILAVDDDPSILKALERSLARESGEPWRFVGVERPSKALDFLESERPDLILLDVLMPEMSGYELCAEIVERDELSLVPIIFVTVLGEGEDRARAFAAGATDVVSKPFDVSHLREKVREHLATQERWKHLAREDGAEAEEGKSAEEEDPNAAEAEKEWNLFDPRAWPAFKEYLREHLSLDPTGRDRLSGAEPHQLLDLADHLALSEQLLARYAADFHGVPMVTGISPEDVAPGLLPPPYCRANLVVPLQGGENAGPETDGSEKDGPGAVVANPFDWDLLQTLQRMLWKDSEPWVQVAEPEVIRSFFTYGEGGDPRMVEAAAEESASPEMNADREVEADTREDPQAHEVLALANEVLRRAASERASDIHVEPKGDDAVIRFRIDGDLTDVRRVSQENARRVIARFKALGNLDVANRRSPQDGALEAVIHGRRFKLRLATTATPHGESLVVRLLEPYAEPPSLEKLGMTQEQASRVRGFASRSSGLVLVVGPTGSGKSTTLFSLLSQVDGKGRSIITVEDPVEYRIPFANQQQVNDRAGATFESLLRSAVRQDPDILLLGEIRDTFSAKASLDFASSGHLTVTTVHSSNATTALFRLERLGVQRGAIADSVLGVVAQQLLKTLCERCRGVREITAEERQWLEPFTDDVPTEVAVPMGCPACRKTGYQGRTGVYEILTFDADVSQLVRDGAAVRRIRDFIGRRGDLLMPHHAVEKVRELLCSPRQVKEAVLDAEAPIPEGEGEERPEPTRPASASVEEGLPGAGVPGLESTAEDEEVERDDEGSATSPGDRAPEPGTVLVVEDDPVQRALLERFLVGDGHEVVTADDGIEALLQLGRRRFDVVVCDVKMPNLDGLELIELMGEKGIDAPVIFVTADSDQGSEVRGLELGAEDFITKPVKQNVLRLRVRNILKRSGRGG